MSELPKNIFNKRTSRAHVTIQSSCPQVATCMTKISALWIRELDFFDPSLLSLPTLEATET